MVFEEFSSFKYDNNDEKFAEEYVIVYSKFLVTSNFEQVKDKMANLARYGHVRSLAKYLRRVEPKDWAEDLKEMTLAIKNGDYVKTPQEWEVVAALDWHKPLQDCSYEHIKTIEDLRKEIIKANNVFYNLEKGYIKDKTNKYDEITRYSARLIDLYERQPYVQSLKKCQEGYYSAYVTLQKPLDGVGFLEFTREPDDLYIPYDNLEQYGNGVTYISDEIAGFLIENFNNIDKNQDCTNEELYSFAFAMTLFGKNDKEKECKIRKINRKYYLSYNG